MNVDDKIDIRELLSIIVRYRRSILIITLLTTLITVIVVFFKPNIYETSTTLELSESRSMPSGEGIFALAMNGTVQSAPKTEIEIIKSAFVVNRALKTVDYTHRYYVSKLRDIELYEQSPFRVEMKKGFGCSYDISWIDDHEYEIESECVDQELEGTFQFGERVKGDFYDFVIYRNQKIEAKYDSYRFQINEPRFAVEQIQKNLSIFQINQQSNILSISFRDTIAKRAQDVVNALANEYIHQGVERKTQNASQALDFIELQLEKTKSDLQKSGAELEEFKKTHVLVTLDSKAEGLMTGMGTMNEELARIKIEEQVLNSLYAQVKAEKNLETISTAGLNLQGSGVPKLIENLQQAVLKRKMLYANYTRSKIDVNKVALEINMFKDAIIKATQSLQERVQTRKKQIEQEISKNEEQLSALPKDERELRRLVREFSLNEKIYSYLMETRAAQAIAKASTVNNSRVIDEALLPLRPVAPKRKLIIAIGLLLGLILGIAYAFIREFLDDKIKEEYIRHHSKLPLFGVIPNMKDNKDEIKVLKSPKSRVSEAYRAVRTNINFMTDEAQSIVISVTSTIGGEGKTTSASNLAAIMSATGKRTIVINLDLRKSMLHLKFNLPNNQGMSSVLAGKVEVEEVIQHTHDVHLDVITAGPTPPNPSELIENQKMKEIISKLRGHYDVIILDTPPVGLVTDAVALMKLSDISLYVLRYGYSKKEFLENAHRISSEFKLKGFGLLLNGVESDKHGYGYYEDEK